jgi:hypothetical protein
MPMATIKLALQHLAEIGIHTIEVIRRITEVVQERPVLGRDSGILRLVGRRNGSRGSEGWGVVAALGGVWS